MMSNEEWFAIENGMQKNPEKSRERKKRKRAERYIQVEKEKRKWSKTLEEYRERRKPEFEGEVKKMLELRKKGIKYTVSAGEKFREGTSYGGNYNYQGTVRGGIPGLGKKR